MSTIKHTFKLSPFFFEDVKKYIDTLESNKEIIRYLIEVKAYFLQSNSAHKSSRDYNFADRCDAEIERIRNLMQLDSEFEDDVKSSFVLAKKKGAKTNIIRILNALYELKLFQKTNGQMPSKKEFMTEIGNIFNEDLSGYHASLSQSLQNQPLEANLKIFYEMIDIVTKMHHTEKE